MSRSLPELGAVFLMLELVMSELSDRTNNNKPRKHISCCSVENSSCPPPPVLSVYVFLPSCFSLAEFDKFLAERAKAAERLPSLRASSQDADYSES